MIYVSTWISVDDVNAPVSRAWRAEKPHAAWTMGSRGRTVSEKARSWSRRSYKTIK
jgi:hypothetical protein